MICFRLSRPKPVITVTRQNGEVLKDENLVVKRNTKGGHEVHRHQSTYDLDLFIVRSIWNAVLSDNILVLFKYEC